MSKSSTYSKHGTTTVQNFLKKFHSKPNINKSTKTILNFYIRLLIVEQLDGRIHSIKIIDLLLLLLFLSYYSPLRKYILKSCTLITATLRLH